MIACHCIYIQLGPRFGWTYMADIIVEYGAEVPDGYEFECVVDKTHCVCVYPLSGLPPDVYQITYLPFRVEAFDVTVVVLSAIAVCLVATLYPSRQAGRIDPAEALRNP